MREGAEAAVAAEAQNAARDLVNAPANELTPTKLAARARELASELGLECEVLGREQIRYAGMGAFAAVAQGTDEEPQLITLKYSPENAVGPVLGLVGKAVTFDSGGISIKPAMKMSAMKSDMAGGAAVLEATGAIARLGLPVRVVAVLGSTENLINGRAVKPGDIVRSRSGTTIEIINTDAEGRLVLCDCLTHAREQGAERLVDVATLTGGMVVALGDVYAGYFASDDDWSETVRAAGDRAGEPLWRMPLHERYADAIKGRWADIDNATEDRKASPVVAAEFLHRFVGDAPWAHLDIAGLGWDGGRPYAAKGGSGFATRTLVEVARGRTNCAALKAARYGARRGSHGAAEVVAQAGGGAEAALAGDGLDGEVGLLEQAAGGRDALGEQPGQGRGAGLGAEAAGEGARRVAGVAGHVIDRERPVQVLEHPGARGGEAGRRVRDRALDELRLAAGAVRGDDDAAGDAVGLRRAEVGADDVQAEVDARGDAG